MLHNVQQVIEIIEKDYPLSYAMDWDNCGLQVGHPQQSITGIGLAVTFDQQKINSALEQGINLVVTHHPILFEPIRQIRLDQPFGVMIERLIKNQIAVYSMHSNLDVLHYGVSDALADEFKLMRPTVLQTVETGSLFKLSVYVPEDHFEWYREQMLNLGVGHIGAYSHCSFSVAGEGTFMPQENSHPYIGQQGVLEKVRELRFETVITERDLKTVLPKMKELHPYEEVAYDVFPLYLKDPSVGLGRIGNIEPRPLGSFEVSTKGVLKGAIDLGRMIYKVAVCGGSGNSVVETAIAKKADLLISAEIGYHKSLLARDHGLAVLDLGHEESEAYILPFLKSFLERSLPSRDFDIQIVS